MIVGRQFAAATSREEKNISGTFPSSLMVITGVKIEKKKGQRFG